MAFLRFSNQSDVYIADFNVQSGALTTPRRLTLDDRYDAVTAWTPDSKSVLLTSIVENGGHFSSRSIAVPWYHWSLGLRINWIRPSRVMADQSCTVLLFLTRQCA